MRACIGAGKKGREERCASEVVHIPTPPPAPPALSLSLRKVGQICELEIALQKVICCFVLPAKHLFSPLKTAP